MRMRFPAVQTSFLLILGEQECKHMWLQRKRTELEMQNIKACSLRSGFQSTSEWKRKKKYYRKAELTRKWTSTLEPKCNTSVGHWRAQVAEVCFAHVRKGLCCFRSEACSHCLQGTILNLSSCYSSELRTLFIYANIWQRTPFQCLVTHIKFSYIVI